MRESHTTAHENRICSRRVGDRGRLSLLIVMYEMLWQGTPYRDLGATHFDQLHRRRTASRLVQRLRSLGYEVQLQEGAA
jgi:hypothetical protein